MTNRTAFITGASRGIGRACALALSDAGARVALAARNTEQLEELAGQIRAAQPMRNLAVTGFVNQSEIPAYYHAADVLVLPSEVETWGLVVNEAMAAGTLPVVSDQVGCVPDLVRGVGEVFRCGDVRDLAGAVSRALARARDPRTCEQVRTHVDRYSLKRTAEGFERAALSVASPPRIQVSSQ